MDRRKTLENPPHGRIASGFEFVRHVTGRSPSLGLWHRAACAPVSRRPRIARHDVTAARCNPEHTARLWRLGAGSAWAKVTSLVSGHGRLLVRPAENLG